jgi:TonB family protein
MGRGGIAGEPVPLDSKDNDIRDYLERIKRLIQQHWVFPCVKDRQTGVCEYKSTELLVEFGILKHGPLQYVEVRRASPYDIYDESAVVAVKLASPFPPVPAAMMARMASGSTGASITARFVYHYETGITNLLR